MSKPHKYAKLIHAFADGKTLQWRNPGLDHWVDYELDSCPAFHGRNEWRVKPELLVMYGRLSNEDIDPDWSLQPYGCDNIKATFDPETQELISVELIK